MKPKFKVGDQVVIKNQKGTHENLNGEKGEVLETYSVGYHLGRRRWYIVKLSNGLRVEASARELDKAEDVKLPKFKIGDQVRILCVGKKPIQPNSIGKIVNYRDLGNQIRIEVRSNDWFNGKVGYVFYPYELEKVEDTQTSSRALNITLDQAKEYYEAGGELRKLALQVFTEDELKPRPKYPKSWNELCTQVECGENIYLDDLVERLYVYHKILQLRHVWIHIWSQKQGLKKDWVPNWLEYDAKYCILVSNQSLCIRDNFITVHPLSFPTRDLAQDFLNTFKDLLEQAKGLY